MGKEQKQTENRRVRSLGLERSLKSKDAAIMSLSPSQLLGQTWTVKGREGNIVRFATLAGRRAGPTK